MAVYVDDMRAPFGRMIMCHMWADTEAELFDMADRIGVARKWVQGHPTLSLSKAKAVGWLHFDISLSRRARAVAAGAVETDRYGPVVHTRRLDLNHPDADRRASAKAMLETVEKLRAKRSA